MTKRPGGGHGSPSSYSGLLEHDTAAGRRHHAQCSTSAPIVEVIQNVAIRLLVQIISRREGVRPSRIKGFKGTTALSEVSNHDGRVSQQINFWICISHDFVPAKWLRKGNWSSYADGCMRITGSRSLCDSREAAPMYVTPRPTHPGHRPNCWP